MNKLSIALAVFNEEKNLTELFQNINGFADEVIVIDGGSTDRTVEIAKKFGARAEITSNPPIFHLNKQKAIDLASAEWILQLDADERLTKALKEEIKTTINDNNTEFNAYWIKRSNYFMGRFMKKTGMYPDPVIRLFRKGKAFLPCKSVHEQMKVSGKIGWLKNDLLHYPYPDFSEYLRKSNTYTSLTAMEYQEKKLGTDWWTKIKYLKILPCLRFLELYFRHKGFMDGFPGLVFSFYSGLHIKTSYIKYWEMMKEDKGKLK